MVNRVFRLTKVFSLEQFSLTPRRVRGGPSLCVQTWAQIPLGSYDWQWEICHFQEGHQAASGSIWWELLFYLCFPGNVFFSVEGQPFLTQVAQSLWVSWTEGKNRSATKLDESRRYLGLTETRGPKKPVVTACHQWLSSHNACVSAVTRTHGPELVMYWSRAALRGFEDHTWPSLGKVINFFINQAIWGTDVSMRIIFSQKPRVESLA